MRVRTYADAAGFLAATRSALADEEVANSLMLGVALQLIDNPAAYPMPPFLATVEDGGALAGAALMTPPHALVVYSPTAEPQPAFVAVADYLLAHGVGVPGVNGRSESARAFAAIWAEKSGVQPHVRLELRAFELRRVEWPPRPSGDSRLAAPVEVELLARWRNAFEVEALQEGSADEEVSEQHRLATAHAIERGSLYVWDDGGPVALAARVRPTLNYMTVNLVYTPPEKRRRGYASALVAEVSQGILDDGYTGAMLFTDLANPTSNHIYQVIGYRPVCDYTRLDFAAAR